jgi:predicted O-linked N-acetylglucosamine transferase (SPINDLY family)
MGVPVITRKGITHGSRYGATILENAGLPELVAKSDVDYVRKAVQIANSMEILEKFHSGLRAVVKKSRLMDGIPYMKDIEDLYRHIWKDYCTFS